MSKDISIQNGANLNLKGLASKEFEVANKSLTYALNPCLLYTSPSPRDMRRSRMPSSA